jgi:hypothetical protein
MVVHRIFSSAMIAQYAVAGDYAGLDTSSEIGGFGAVESRTPFLVGYNIRSHDRDHRLRQPAPDCLYSSYDCRTQTLRSVLL